jgi:putative restriction endonuclease
MGFGVFIHRSDSIYEDSPAEQYQFPSQYLRRAEACVGDWIIYYEPRKIAETRGYFAIAKVSQVIADPGTSGMYIALIEPGSYLDFANPVPFNGATGPVEQGVLNDQGRISGRAQSAVRPISPEDFNRIIELGFEEKALLLPRFGSDMPSFGFDEEQTPFRFDQQRDRVSVTVSRILRDRVFRRVVLRAYDERCAITGLKLINEEAGGRKLLRHISGRWKRAGRISSAMGSRSQAQHIGCLVVVLLAWPTIWRF